jgi:hypothetical protein
MNFSRTRAIELHILVKLAYDSLKINIQLIFSSSSSKNRSFHLFLGQSLFLQRFYNSANFGNPFYCTLSTRFPEFSVGKMKLNLSL